MNIQTLTSYAHGPISGEKPKQLVILLHGLGSDGKDLISLSPLYAQKMPDAVFVAPDAPFPCDMAPMGYQWFSLQSRAPEDMKRGAENAAPILENFIAEQMDKYEIAAGQVVLVGFSQGTMMSLYIAPRLKEKIAGIVAYSGALLGEEFLKKPESHKMPICLVHGVDDDVVPFQAYYHAKAHLEASGFDVDAVPIRDLGHSIDEIGVQAANRFFKKIFSL